MIRILAHLNSETVGLFVRAHTTPEALRLYAEEELERIITAKDDLSVLETDYREIEYSYHPPMPPAIYISTEQACHAYRLTDGCSDKLNAALTLTGNFGDAIQLLETMALEISTLEPDSVELSMPAYLIEDGDTVYLPDDFNDSDPMCVEAALTHHGGTFIAGYDATKGCKFSIHLPPMGMVTVPLVVTNDEYKLDPRYIAAVNGSKDITLL